MGRAGEEGRGTKAGQVGFKCVSSALVSPGVLEKLDGS